MPAVGNSLVALRIVQMLSVRFPVFTWNASAWNREIYISGWSNRHATQELKFLSYVIDARAENGLLSCISRTSSTS